MWGYDATQLHSEAIASVGRSEKICIQGEAFFTDMVVFAFELQSRLFGHREGSL
jgi:hypothetical protein